MTPIRYRIFPLGRFLIFFFLAFSAFIGYFNITLIVANFFEVGGWESVIRNFPQQDVLIAVILTLLSLWFFLSFRSSVAKITLSEHELRYQNRLLKIDVAIPLNRIKRIEVRRMTFSFRTYGSVSEIFLIAQGQSEEVSLSLGAPLFMASRNLKLAEDLSQCLNIPISDPVGDTLRSRTFFWDRWKYHGQDYKILLVIFGVAILFVVAIYWREKNQEKESEEFLRNYQKTITDPKEKEVYDKFFKLKEELEKESKQNP